MAFGSILNQAPEGAVPKGCILLWSGQANAIPSGWALCDGNNGTPNLLNRFVVGAGNKYIVGATGGEENHTLTVSEMPSHNHSLSSSTTSSAGEHSHEVVYKEYSKRYYAHDIGWGYGSSGYDAVYFKQGSSGSYMSAESSGSHTHTLSGSVGSKGSGTAHNNMPPYYALCYIMKL